LVQILHYTQLTVSEIITATYKYVNKQEKKQPSLVKTKNKKSFYLRYENKPEATF
jgi:hypothetical protein